MAARKNKTTRMKTSRRSAQEALNRLEKELPPNLRRLVKQVRRNLNDMQKQLEKARTDREARWNQMETQMRRDAVKLIKRLEKVIEPKTARKLRKKTAPKKTGRSAGTATA